MKPAYHSSVISATFERGVFVFVHACNRQDLFLDNCSIFCIWMAGISIFSGGFVRFALPTLMDFVYLHKSGTIAHMSGGVITPSSLQQTIQNDTTRATHSDIHIYFDTLCSSYSDDTPTNAALKLIGITYMVDYSYTQIMKMMCHFA